MKEGDEVGGARLERTRGERMKVAAGSQLQVEAGQVEALTCTRERVNEVSQSGSHILSF